MKKSFSISILTVVILLISCSSTSFNQIRGDKNIVKKEFTITDYNKIQIGGAKEVIYRQSKSDKPQLFIEIDGNLLQYVEVGVKNGTLTVITKGENVNIQPSVFRVYTNSKNLNDININGSANFRAESDITTDYINITGTGASKITFQDLETKDLKAKTSGVSSLSANTIQTDKVDLESSGSGNINIQELNNTHEVIKCGASGASHITIHSKVVSLGLNIEASGSASTKISEISVEDLNCSTSGASTITLSGKSEAGILEASGASNIKAENLFVNDVSAKTSGSSSITLYASDKLKASASGASKIRYAGNPQADISTSGSSSIKKKN